MGHGLNLQDGGNTIVWFGLNWNLEITQQANARLHRQGQKEKVFVHYLITQDTVDEDVMASLAKKDKGQQGLIEAIKARITGEGESV
jgi:SNF2 family DNA or RNA helicase